MTSLSSFVDLPIEEQKARGLLFTPREIAQQPDTWEVTLGIFKEHRERIRAFLDSAGVRDSLEQRPVVMLIGAGTSDYVGQALELLLRQKWGCEVSAVASTDLLPNLEEYIVPGRRYLWISFSRSGDSPEGVAVLEQAIRRYPGIAHMVVTCNAQARMAEICEEAKRACVVVLDDAVNDRSLAMTSSFTNMIVMGQCLANAWSIEEYTAVVERLVRAGRDLLLRAAGEAERIASRGFSRVCLIGAGPLASVAKESALKVLEMTAGKVQAMSETVLGLRHGPMAALNTQTLFLCFVSGDERKAKYASDLLREIGEKGIVGERIAVGPASALAEIAPYCNSYIALDDDIDDAYRPVVDVIFGQLLGLYCSVAHALKPDSPSPGGVINRVVQKFRIY
ncbi:tagatose-6-phosphate ketose isomerase [Granulicella arctica]|uniref:Tagatose-6-phosphate ketose/aldose isomerase n=1 Tax=Granulicella arctica TaxID=940613 RepID=A0A7Y9PDW4_9BACT|nr:tagatose-6-phosphate ketose/aldose isomerase [Granulicella arctica]